VSLILSAIDPFAEKAWGCIELESWHSKALLDHNYALPALSVPLTSQQCVMTHGPSAPLLLDGPTSTPLCGPKNEIDPALCPRSQQVRVRTLTL